MNERQLLLKSQLKKSQNNEDCACVQREKFGLFCPKDYNMALMYTGRRQIDRYRLIEDGEADKKIDRQIEIEYG